MLDDATSFYICLLQDSSEVTRKIFLVHRSNFLQRSFDVLIHGMTFALYLINLPHLFVLKVMVACLLRVFQVSSHEPNHSNLFCIVLRSKFDSKFMSVRVYLPLISRIKLVD